MTIEPNALNMIEQIMEVIEGEQKATREIVGMIKVLNKNILTLEARLRLVEEK